jgi:hypothetical protein
MKNDTAQVRQATVGQVKDIGATAVQAIPTELSFEMAADVLRRKTEFIEHIRAFFPDSASLTDPKKQWENFYEKVFGLSCDFSGVKIPERTDEQKKEFTRLLIVVGTLSNNQVYDACAKHFKCWRYADNLDSAVPKNDRGNDTYAVWVRDVIEADEILKNKSAKDIKREGLKTETLKERMIHELKYFLETGKHLDIQNVTLCSGSRYSDGGVPGALWYDDKFRVHWYSAGYQDENLRAREVIS